MYYFTNKTTHIKSFKNTTEGINRISTSRMNNLNPKYFNIVLSLINKLSKIEVENE